MPPLTSIRPEPITRAHGQHPTITEPVSTLPVPSGQPVTSQPVSTQSVRERIRLALIQRISDGTYKPGERLKELSIAQEFNVSQAPVREAFRELQTLGVLVSEHYRGTRVRNLSMEETRDVYQLRGHLEEIAAQLIPLPQLKLVIDAIESHQIAMRAASHAGDAEAFANANILFHRTIVELSTNLALRKMWDSLEIGMRSRLNVHRNARNLIKLAEVHQPIVDALRAEDLKLAGTLLREHSFSFSMDLH